MSVPYGLSQAARADLDEIWTRIGADKPIAADRVIGDLRARYRALSNQPFLGQACDHVRPGLRCSVVGNYVTYYRIVEERVLILRVVHGARDTALLRWD